MQLKDYFHFAGILALAWQWKCVIIGTEGAETLFGISHTTSVRKPVVGRGVLTTKDLEFLIKDSRAPASDIDKVDVQGGETISPIKCDGKLFSNLLFVRQ